MYLLVSVNTVLYHPHSVSDRQGHPPSVCDRPAVGRGYSHIHDLDDHRSTGYVCYRIPGKGNTLCIDT